LEVFISGFGFKDRKSSYRLSAIGYQFSANGCWFSAFGYQLSAFGFQLSFELSVISNWLFLHHN